MISNRKKNSKIPYICRLNAQKMNSNSSRHKYLLVLTFFVGLFSQNLFAQASDFITRWDLSKTGGAGNNNISFYTTNAGGSISYTWQELSPGSASGSGTFTAGTAAHRSILSLPANAIIELRIAPTNLQRFYINGDINRDRLVDVTQWGSVGWTSMEKMFSGCSNLGITSTDVPDLSNTTSMQEMFANCAGLNGPGNIGTWNTSTITNMQQTFEAAYAFNQNISGWNVSNVTNMASMFWGAATFNQNIGGWNTGNVTNMSMMFYVATVFNQNIGSWNTGKVTNMAGMFSGAIAFNQNLGSWNTAAVTTMQDMFRSASVFNGDISSWNTGNVIDMSGMFTYAYAFNQNIGSWNTGKVTNMNSMFSGATVFNQNIGNWNTANVTDMRYMFYDANAFNQNIGNWNTGKVTNMLSIFQNAYAFNQNIGNWNVGNVTNMSAMFNYATSFNQDLSRWNVSNVTNMSNMFTRASAFNQNLGNWVLKTNVNLTWMLDRSGLSCDNYSRTLALWALTTTATGRQLGALGKVYGTNVALLRNELLSKSWAILDSGSSGTLCGPVVFYSKSTGNLNDLSTWGDNADGTGNSPINFTTADQIFVVRNRSTAGLSSNWTVSGSNSMVVVGDGTAALSFSTGSHLISGNYRIANNATLEIASNSTSISIVGEPGSTVSYNGTGDQTVAAGQYHHLNLGNNRGGSTMTLASGDITVRGTMTHTLSNTGSWVNTGSTFRYAGTGAQTIAPIPYNNLVVEGPRSGSPSMTLGVGTVGVSGNFAITASGLGAWITTGNTVDYNGNSAQQIGVFNYNNLSISGARNNSSITLQDGTIRVAGSLAVSATQVGSWATTGNTVEYNGTSAQTVSSAIPYRNLIVGGSGAKTLNGNTTVAGDLTLNNTITLGAHNLTLSGEVIGAGSTKYVQTSGVGMMKKTIGSGASFTFPVGNSAYNPVSISNNTGSADEFSARVLDEVYYGGVAGNVAAEPRVRRTWNIGKLNPNAGSGVNMTFNWNTGEQTSGISNYKLYSYTGGAWQKQTGSTSVSGTSLTYTGYSGGFNSFTIGDDVVILPVTWLYLKCNRMSRTETQLQWATASEFNALAFEIQRANGSGGFKTIGRVQAAGNSHGANPYIFNDVSAPEHVATYRIQLFFEDGNLSSSEVCSVPAFDINHGSHFTVYPNPAETSIHTELPVLESPYIYHLFNHAGQLVKQGFIQGGKAEISLLSVKPGLYILQAQSGEATYRERVLVR